MQVVVLVAPLFEESELIYPYYRLQEAGHRTVLVAAEPGEYRGKHGVPVQAEAAASQLDPDDLAGVVIPGGYSPDHMRRSPAMVELVAKVGSAGRPVAAICHAGWMLASAGLAGGRRLTSYPSIKDDMVNAGAEWVDEEVVVDGNLITSRRPGDLPAFMREVLRALGS